MTKERKECRRARYELHSFKFDVHGVLCCRWYLSAILNSRNGEEEEERKRESDGRGGR